jgi:hypothetical protein
MVLFHVPGLISLAFAQEGAAEPDACTHGPSILVGLPNLAAIRAMLGAYGYRVERLSDWAGLLRDNPAPRTSATTPTKSESRSAASTRRRRLPSGTGTRWRRRCASWTTLHCAPNNPFGHGTSGSRSAKIADHIGG